MSLHHKDREGYGKWQADSNFIMLGMRLSVKRDCCFKFKACLDGGCFYYKISTHPVTSWQRYKMPRVATMGPIVDVLGLQGGVRIGRDQLRNLAQFGQMLQGRLAGF